MKNASIVLHKDNVTDKWNVSFTETKLWKKKYLLQVASYQISAGNGYEKQILTISRAPVQYKDVILPA